MNQYEKFSLIQELIQDLERRLGQYIWLDGCEKTDEYAKGLILAIQDYRLSLAKLCEHEVIVDG